MNSECKECRKSFSNSSNLRKHIKKFHEQKLTELLPYKIKYVTKKFTQVCARNFDQEKHLRFHNKKHVSINQVNNSIVSVKGRNCPLCTFQTRFNKDFKGHFQQQHNIQLELEIYEFSDKESFEKWKSFVKKDTSTRYTKTEHFSAKSYHVIKYCCNRSGYYNSRSQGMRHLKTQGNFLFNLRK